MDQGDGDVPETVPTHVTPGFSSVRVDVGYRVGTGGRDVPEVVPTHAPTGVTRVDAGRGDGSFRTPTVCSPQSLQSRICVHEPSLCTRSANEKGVRSRWTPPLHPSTQPL